VIVLGADPSITALGIGVVDRSTREVLHLETVRSDTDEPDEARYLRIYRRLCSVIRAKRVVAVAVEEQRRVQVGAQKRREFNGNNSKVSIVVGLVMGAAWAHGLPVFVVTPQCAKNAVLGKGNGNAKKQQVKAAVRNMLGDDAGVFSADAADGVAIACAPSLLEIAQALKSGT